MTTNNRGIVSASRDELIAIWVLCDDLLQLFEYAEWLMWCKIVGVQVNG